MARTALEFLETFVLPLVRGGELHVGRPISFGEAAALVRDLPHASVPLVAIDDARSDILSQIVVRPPALVLDEDELFLAAALHNLLFLAHPSIESFTVSKRAEARVVDTAMRMATRPLSQKRTVILARHALLHNLHEIHRVDVTVSWWTGSARFFGQKAPARLTRWQSVRRVRQDETVVDFDHLLATEVTSPVVSAMLRRSPLTLLLSSHAMAPDLQWEDLVFILREPELARAVAYAAIGAGESARMSAVLARYAAAFDQMLERSPKPADVRAVAAFLVYLNALVALAEGETRASRSAKSPFLNTVLAPDRASERPRGLTTFLALPNALEDVDNRLAAPPGLEGGIERRWRQHREQVSDGVGAAVVEALADRLRRHLTA